MNIDKILSGLFSGYNENLSPKKLLNYIKREAKRYDSKRVYIILQGWHEDPWLNNFLKRRILARKYSYVSYSFKPEILSANLKLTEITFKNIRKKILSDLRKLNKRFSEIILVGISLNSVSATMIANSSGVVSRLVLVSPGHSLAESLWSGVRTKKIKEELVNNGVSLKKLKNSWKDLAPENNLSNLSRKEILIYVSKADKIVP